MSLKAPAKLCSEMVPNGLHDAELWRFKESYKSYKSSYKTLIGALIGALIRLLINNKVLLFPYKGSLNLHNSASWRPFDTISEHSFDGAFGDIMGEFGKVLGAENLLGR